VLEQLRPLIGRDGPLFAPLAEPAADDDSSGLADDAARAVLITALGPTPVAIDDIVLHTGLKSSVVSVLLLELDLAGRIEHHGNQLISLIG
jgi:DNA processing protein